MSPGLLMFSTLLSLLPVRLAAQFAGRAHAVGNPVRPLAGESLSVSGSPASLAVTLVPKGKSSGVSYTLTVTWNFSQTRSTSMWAYFASATAALSGGSPTVNIPSSAVSSSTYGSSTQVPFTATNPFTSTNSSVKLGSNQSLSGSNSGSTTITMVIDCTNQTQLPAGTYTGVLYLQAQAI